MTVYSGVDDPREWVLARALQEQAERAGDTVAVRMTSGEALTYAELAEQSARVATMLSGLGLAAGDRVAIMASNSLDFVRVWAGVQRLGAAAVLLNPELMGDFLLHPLSDATPDLLVIDAGLLDRFETLQALLPSLDRVVVIGDAPNGHAAFNDWRIASPYEGPFPTASDIACIMYTSGTTGAPKGVLMPHAHCFLFGLGVIENLGITEADRYYICLPLFHANGLLMQFGAVLISGASATIKDRFSASSWLSDIRACGATVTHSLGAISAFVLSRPEKASDRDHQLRLLFSAPNHPDHDRAWRDRFGIAEVVGGYGMTESNIPLYGDRNDPRPGTCGKVYGRCFEVEIRDPETDLPVPVDEVGEIMVRPRIGQAFMAGYIHLPEKTVEAWRNLWFHTGDAGRMAEDGYVTFVDRIKDCIRRRGENVSAADIEAVISRLPGVVEVAAFAVPSGVDGGEDEIMLAIVAHPDRPVSAEQVATHSAAAMPRFAQPRWIDFVPTLPKTSTEKVRKAELRAAGITPNAIDLEALAARSSPAGATQALVTAPLLQT